MGSITDLVSGFGDMSDWSKNALIDITLLGTGTGIALKAFGTGATVVSGFIKNMDKMVASINLAHEGLNLTTQSLGLWGLGIGSAVLAVGGLIYWIATADERLAEFNRDITASIVESQEKIVQSQDNIVKAQEAIAEIKRLEDELANTSGKDAYAEKEAELLEYKKQLLELFPGLADGYKNEEAAIEDITGALDGYIKKQEESIKLEQQSAAADALKYFNKSKDNKDIVPEMDEYVTAQKSLEQLLEKKKELVAYDDEALVKYTYNGKEYTTTVKDMLNTIDRAIIDNTDVMSSNKEEMDQFKTSYEALIAGGQPVSEAMTEMYNSLKQLEDGTYEASKALETFEDRTQFSDSIEYTDKFLKDLAKTTRESLDTVLDLGDGARETMDSIISKMESGDISVQEFRDVYKSCLSTVGLDFGELGDIATTNLDRILVAYDEGSISSEQYQAAVGAMAQFSAESFNTLSETAQADLLSMLQGMDNNLLGIETFQLGVDSYLGLVGDSFDKMTEAETLALDTMVEKFASGNMSAEEFTLAMGTMGLLTSEQFYALDENTRNTINSFVSQFDFANGSVLDFATGVMTNMGISQEAINQLASLSTVDIQTLMNNFLSGELSAEQLQQAIDYLHNNPNLPADIAMDMATTRTAMQETENEIDTLQSDIDALHNNDGWTQDMANDAQTVIDGMKDGTLSGDELQERIDTLKDNPAFANNVGQNMLDIIGKMKETIDKRDELQGKIDELQGNSGWASTMSGQFDTVKTSASNANTEVKNLNTSIGGLKGKTVNLNVVTNYSSTGTPSSQGGAVPISMDGIPNNQPVYSVPDDNPVPTEPTPSGNANVPMVAKARESVQVENTSNDYGIATAATISAPKYSFDTSKNYDNLSEEEKALQQERERLESAANSAIEKLRNKLYTALKKKIEKQKQDELSIYDARIEAIKKEMALLDESVSTSTEDTLAGERTKLEKLQAELNKWEENNSAFAISKVTELKEAILAQEEAVKKAEVDLKKEQLQTQIDFIEEEKNVASEKYEQMLTEEYLYTEANKLLLSQNMNQMLELIENFSSDFSDIGLLLGKSLANGIVESITEGLDGFNYLKNYGSTTRGSTSSGVSTSSGSSTNWRSVVDEIVAEETSSSSKGRVATTNLNVREGAGNNNKVIGSIYKNEEVDILDEKDGWYNIQYWSDVYKKNSKGWVLGQYLQRFNTGGLVGSWNDGQPRMAMVDTKERVLSAEQTKSFDDLVYKFLPQFASMVRSLKGVGNTDKSSSNNNVTFNNNYEVTNKTEFDVKNNMETMEYRQKQQLRRAGVL